MPCQLSLPIIIIYLVALAAANTNGIIFSKLASIIVTPEKNYSTASPTWLTSPYFRADSKLIISTLTGSGQYPFASFTFTYSSALPNIPNLAYGIKKYSGTENNYRRRWLFDVWVFRDQDDWTNSIHFQCRGAAIRNDEHLVFSCSLHSSGSYFPPSPKLLR